MLLFLLALLQCSVGSGQGKEIVVPVPDIPAPPVLFALQANDSYAPAQMTGPPDTPNAGDFGTAWASKTEDLQREWVELDYEKAIVPVRIDIYETYNPGAVYRITAFADKQEKLLWEGADPTPKNQAKGVSKIDLQTDLAVRKIRIYLNSPAVPGWNEIDAVGIVDANKKTHWAAGARATTSYANNIINKFDDPFLTDEQLRRDQLAVIRAEIDKRKAIVRSYEAAIDAESARIKVLIKQLSDLN